jgi:hypothetical protein
MLKKSLKNVMRLTLFYLIQINELLTTGMAILPSMVWEECPTFLQWIFPIFLKSFLDLEAWVVGPEEKMRLVEESTLPMQ